MIRAVVDTNILVSALLSPEGLPSQILLEVLTGEIQLCLSASIYAEYEEVLRRPRFQRSEAELTAVLAFLRERCLWVRPTQTVAACSDPDDDIFLECAVAPKRTTL